LPKLVTAHAAILLAPPVERQFGNADLANGIRHRHALAAQNLNLPKLRDDLVGLVSLVCHCGPPSWSKPYFKVDPFNGGGSRLLAILDPPFANHNGGPLHWGRITLHTEFPSSRLGSHDGAADAARRSVASGKDRMSSHTRSSPRCSSE